MPMELTKEAKHKVFQNSMRSLSILNQVFSDYLSQTKTPQALFVPEVTSFYLLVSWLRDVATVFLFQQHLIS